MSRDHKKDLRGIRDRLDDGLPLRFRRNLEDLGVEAALEHLENELRDIAHDIDRIIKGAAEDARRA